MHEPLAMNPFRYRPYRVMGQSRRHGLAVPVAADRGSTFFVERITVEKGERGDLFAHGLKLSGHCMSHEAAKRPAQQVVRANSLNPSDNAQIVRRHAFNGVGQYLPLEEIAGL